MALKILEVIERDGLADHARNIGAFLKSELERLAATYPGIIRNVRGLGLMIGFELAEKAKIPALSASEKPASLQVVGRLHAAGLLTIPAGMQVIRLLPALNLRREEAQEGLRIIESVIQELGTRA